MRTLLIDPFSGIAGDMFTAALLDLGVIDHTKYFETLKTLNIRDCSATADKILKNGISAHKFTVTTSAGIEGPGGLFENKGKKKFIPLTKITSHVKTNSHDHRSLTEVLKTINDSALPDDVKKLSCQVFTELGKSEAFIHNKNLETVHFHEVGAADAIMDICAACLAVITLKVDKIVCRPIAVGGGTVKTAHGILPVPAPATAKLLEGVPTLSGPAERELTTPTGAALIKTLCDEFCNGANGTLLACGYGAGTLNFKTHANVVKVTLLESSENAKMLQDQITCLKTNIDDMPGEQLTSIIPELLELGALDVSCTPCMMKKGRQAFTLEVLCHETKTEALAEYILTNSSSFGIRYTNWSRFILKRQVLELDTEFGKINAKAGYLDGKLIKISPEYEFCKNLSLKKNVPVTQIYSAVHAASLPLLLKN
jgi:pyridinium-3,5-bisthiocarboxylic acid mononucleotide nickel chelatase